jgi:glycosyltransferase involved in cell wall biosynthesis
LPAISVILPVYNGEHYLKSAIDGVLAQSLSDFELLIVDDCSTDNSWEYLNSLTDNRIRLYRNQQNRGLFYNLNFLIKQSHSDLIKLWAQDDVMYKDCLQKIVSFHQQYPQIGFSYTSVDYIDENGTRLEKSDTPDNTPVIIDKYLHASICFYTGSITGNISNVTLAKQALDKVGLFNEAMKMSGDFEMWVRIAEFFDIGFLKEKLIALRDHSNQLSRKEQYYINAVKEDAITYKHLLSYLPQDVIQKGKKNLRSAKLNYYYTLMLKFILKGKFSVAKEYYKCIKLLDNPAIMFFYYMRNKFASTKK